MGNEVAVVLPDDGTALKQAERSWSKSQLRTRLVSSPAALIPRKAGFGKAATTADAPLRVCIVVRPNKATAIVCTCSRTRAKPRYVILLETLAMHPDATTEVVQLCYALHQHFEMVQTDQVVL